MTDSHQVIFYPVNNGDTSQIVLASGRRILFDFCHRNTSEDAETPEIDLRKRLSDELSDANRDYFDVVAFTHADWDHIQGSTDFFELQHDRKYQGDDRIKIQELWVPAAMLLEKPDKDHQTEEFDLLQKEAWHRLLVGKDILVFSKPPDLTEKLEPLLKARGMASSARDHLFIDAGTIVPGFDLDEDRVEFFCHSPFIKHCEEGDIIRNSAALIFNVRFSVGGATYDLLAIGDAECSDLEDIVNITRYHHNEDRLEWNLFNIPHHCSYLALNEEKGERETTPTPLVKDLLLMGRLDAYLVSSSKPIPDIRDSYAQVQPPHIQARKAYERHLKEIGGRKFLVTMEEPSIHKPEPLIFEISAGGVTKLTGPIGAPAIVTSGAPRAGLRAG